MTTANPVIGTWELKSYVREIQETTERIELFGARPFGRLVYAPSGHVAGLMLHETRPKPMGKAATDAEALSLFRSMVAYTGRYEVRGDTVVHHVDASWNEVWTGTDLVRTFKLDGRTLTLTTVPGPSAVDGKTGISILVWEKVD